MSPFASESAWLCLAAAAVLGGTLLCGCRSGRQLRSQAVCLAGLWGGACLLSLSLLCTLFLLSVVNNAGVFHLPIDGELIPMSIYRKCMAVNFFGTVEVTKAFLPLLRKSKGRLVNVSSMGGTVPLQMTSAYAATKAALTMFSTIIRQELDKWGVKVVTIKPGGFKTNITGSQDIWDKMEKEILDHFSKDIQENYGQDYVHTQKLIIPTLKERSNPDITPVLRDIQHAISARNPSSFYYPGRMAYLWVCLAAYCPTSLLDYVIKKGFYPQPTPRALRTVH